jgi:hypothetical protein
MILGRFGNLFRNHFSHTQQFWRVFSEKQAFSTLTDKEHILNESLYITANSIVHIAVILSYALKIRKFKPYLHLQTFRKLISLSLNCSYAINFKNLNRIPFNDENFKISINLRILQDYE